MVSRTFDLSSVTGWTGRRALRVGTYPLDLVVFIGHALAAWIRRGHLRNRATRRITAAHVLLTGLNALPATLITALAIGLALGLPLVPFAAAIGEAQLGEFFMRLLGLEVGPLFTAVIVLGRAGSAMATELANMKLHGETAALEQLGIDIRDFFIAPRLIAGAVAQLVLATYFTTVALFGGALLAGRLVSGSGPELVLATMDAIDPLHLAAFVGKNLVFGLVIAAAACYGAVQVTRAPFEVPQRVQRGLTSGLVLVFLLNGLMALAWL